MIQPHSSWAINDSTKMEDYYTCPRMFMFRHRLGWKSDKPENHLVFGEAMHKGIEHITLHGLTNESILTAYNDCFLPCYRRDFDESSDTLYSPKTPQAALQALLTYAMDDKAREFYYDWEPLDFDGVPSTEICGSVPVDADLRMSFRIDAILKQKETGRMCVQENKTSGAKGYFRSIWRDERSMSIQAGMYTHVLYCMYPKEIVEGVIIHAFFFEELKAGPRITIEIIPLALSFEWMQVWHWNLLQRLRELELWDDMLMNSKIQNAEILRCFPINTTSCSKYGGCSFKDYCFSWPNPLHRADEPPIGFKEHFWNPHDLESKHNLDLMEGNLKITVAQMVKESNNDAL